MGEIIIDEWIWADLAGENSREAKKSAFNFICKIFDKCDRIVMVKGSKYNQKLWTFCKNAKSVWDCQVVKYYLYRFYYNMSKSVLLEGNALKLLPEQLANETNADDHYLVQALLTTGAQIFVTTDTGLKDVLNKFGHNCVLRDEFVDSYILS